MGPKVLGSRLALALATLRTRVSAAESEIRNRPTIAAENIRNAIGDGGGGPDDPLIQALIQKLRPTGPWSADDRIQWLRMLVIGFQIAYGTAEEIKVAKDEAAN
jgi:hypothetical protein